MHPILIRLGPLTVPTYGVLVAAAYLVGISWLKSQAARMPGMDENKFWTLIYGIFFGAILGGKLLFMALEWRLYWDGELGIFRDFRYGFVFFGGLLGALAAGLILTRRLKLPFLATADYFGVALPMGHWIGRLGCLAAGCCYGRPTSMPWGVRLGGDPASSTPVPLWGVPLHPTQLYEAATDIMICLFLLRRVLPRARKGEVPAGTVFMLYVLLYSIARFINEFY
ncbi:MAG: prolipoprotein diacylglyceryl transferase, partial [Elusimicrobia bacterium]|nr:prolipoprotein diacylglyceryl transferase [Elusimicrobiota bacterium]